uniref:Uncharacterized protein n=1 Tax=Gasterosteus aculeatus TaxID=69293 RepID=G3Q3S3_GASAC
MIVEGLFGVESASHPPLPDWLCRELCTPVFLLLAPIFPSSPLHPPQIRPPPLYSSAFYPCNNNGSAMLMADSFRPLNVQRVPFCFCLFRFFPFSFFFF